MKCRFHRVEGLVVASNDQFSERVSCLPEWNQLVQIEITFYVHGASSAKLGVSYQKLALIYASFSK